MDMDRIRATVRDRIAARGTTAKAASREAGLNPTYVRDLLTSRSSTAKLEHLSRLAAVLDLRMSDLLPDDGPRRSPVSQRFAEALQLARLSPADAARVLGIPETDVKAYMSGSTPIPYDVLVSLGMRADLSLDWLIGGKPQPPHHPAERIAESVGQSLPLLDMASGRGRAR